MRNLNRIVGTGLAALVLAACEATTGGEDSLSPTEKLQLTNALTSSGALSAVGPAAGYAPFAVQLLPSIGSLSAGGAAVNAAVNRAIVASLRGVQAATYEGALGVQINYSITDQTGTVTGVFTGVIGWAGFNSAAGTVDEIVTAGTVTASAPSDGLDTPIGSVSTNPTRTGYGTYFARTTQSSYLGTSGSFFLSDATFSGTNSECGLGLGGVNVQCSYTTGTLSGDFDFAATRTAGSGPTSYTQTTVVFTNLPAVRMNITVTN